MINLDDPIYCYTYSNLYPYIDTFKRKMAFGAAASYTKGAMDAGLNAIEAVRLAILNTDSAVHPIRYVDLKEPHPHEIKVIEHA